MDIAHYRAKLLALRDDLSAESEKTRGSRQPVELDQQAVGRVSRADAMRDQAMAIELERRREQQRLRVDAALKRVADGTFGECLACGELIGEKRLDLDPTLPTCVACAGKAAGPS
ncbi:MAG: TraR/DksA family transcriptional regulator [Rhodobacteraceae bacterium]|nr:TraR/DksA family transcriptional regulator [Paracoccaceae bacterium]